MASALSPNTMASSLPPASCSSINTLPPTVPTSALAADEPTLISRICQIFKNLIASISRCLHALQTKIKNLFNNCAAPAATPNNNSPTPPTPDAPGVYLERRCECLPPRVDLLGTSGEFNIIQRRERLGIGGTGGGHCSTCNHDYHTTVIVRGLNHRVEFLEYPGNSERIITNMAMEANEVRNHILNTNYRFYNVIV